MGAGCSQGPNAQRLSKGEFAAIVEAVRKGPDASGLLDLHGKKIGRISPRSILQVSEGIKKHSGRIKRLGLRRCGLEDESFRILLPCIRQARGLEEIYLSVNSLGDETCKALAAAIRGSRTSVLSRSWPVLSRLDFEGNKNMSPEGIHTLKQAIATLIVHPRKEMFTAEVVWNTAREIPSTNLPKLTPAESPSSAAVVLTTPVPHSGIAAAAAAAAPIPLASLSAGLEQHGIDWDNMSLSEWQAHVLNKVEAADPATDSYQYWGDEEQLTTDKKKEEAKNYKRSTQSTSEGVSYRLHFASRKATTVTLHQGIRQPASPPRPPGH